MSLKLGGTGLDGNKLKCIIGIHGHWKNQNPGGRFGATSQTALPIQPIWPIFLVDRLNWQCCLAGSSKTAPRILVFSMAMGADYSFELIFNETCAPQFKWHNKSFLGSVVILWFALTNLVCPPIDCVKFHPITNENETPFSVSFVYCTSILSS